MLHTYINNIFFAVYFNFLLLIFILLILIFLLFTSILFIVFFVVYFYFIYFYIFNAVYFLLDTYTVFTRHMGTMKNFFSILNSDKLYKLVRNYCLAHRTCDLSVGSVGKFCTTWVSVHGDGRTSVSNPYKETYMVCGSDKMVTHGV